MRKLSLDGTVIDVARNAYGRFTFSITRANGEHIELVLTPPEAEALMDALMIEYVQ